MTVPAARPSLSRAELRAYLVESRIAGDVATPRASNTGNIRRCLDRDPLYTFGLEPARPWTYDEVVAVMAGRAGIDPDPAREAGPDRIDPDRTLDRLDALAARLRQAVQRRERVLVATGHPAGVLAIHLGVAAALAAAGCTVVTPAEGWSSGTDHANGIPAYREIRYLGGVAMLSDRGELKHTHSAKPMQAILAELRAAGEPWPDLVVADHGWAGAAAQAGIDTVGYADCNDPALFLGEAEGVVRVTVPLDDNVLPHLYAPVTAYLLAEPG